MKSQKIIFWTIGFLASAVIAVAIGEVVVRQFQLSKTWNAKQEEERHRAIIEKYIPDYEKIGYTFLPNVEFISVREKPYRINSTGFRDSEFKLKKKQRRVAFLGDSVIEGFGVEEEDRAADLAEKQLNESNVNIEFYNFSLGGYSTYDELAVLKTHVLKHQPDYAILQVCFNDLEHNFALSRSKQIHAFQNKEKFSGLKSWLQNRAAFYLFLAEYYNYRKLTNNQANELLDDILNAREELWELTFQLLEEFIQTCRNEEIEPVLMYMPYEVEILIENESSGNYATERFAEFCQKQDVKFIEATAALRQQKNKSTLYFDHCHFSERGNEAVGEVLANFFKKQIGEKD
ncbi:MAG: hypothetical protein COA57_00585 [Flavobacteriales bacterium]|nr:MAG: hypothetical protein COA57_00585 [Flavobacteriales bacterium]